VHVLLLKVSSTVNIPTLSSYWSIWTVLLTILVL